MADNTNLPAEGASSGAPEASEPSIREALESAFNEPEQGAQRSDDPPAHRAPAAPEGEPPMASRDERGRFAPGKPGEQQHAQQRNAAPTQGAPTMPGAQQAQQAAAPELKAPASWKPQAREKWGAIDPDLKAEIHRRENEHQHTLQQAAGARQFVDAFERVVRPYEMFIRAENSTPLDAVDNLMRMAATMRTGSPQQKVDVVASIISQWGIDLPMLDRVVSASIQGRPVQGMPAQQQAQQFRDPRVDQLLAMQAQQAQYAQAAQVQEVANTVTNFAADPKHEFFEDVRVVMGDLIEMAARRGQIMNVDDAYARACQLDENVSKITAQRAQARNAGAGTQAALRARRAASSVRGDASLHDGVTIPKNDSIRAALEAAFEESGSRSR